VPLTPDPVLIFTSCLLSVLLQFAQCPVSQLPGGAVLTASSCMCICISISSS
jgi:hypothetical protein